MAGEAWVTQFGALAEIDQDSGDAVTLLGALVELGTDTINITLLGVLCEIEEVIIPVATYFTNPNPGGTKHHLLPEPVSGYQLDAGGSFWSIVLPQSGTNLIKNPSMEGGTTGWVVALWTANVISTEKASRGFHSYKLTPAVGFEGSIAYQYIYPTQTGWHTWSFDLYAEVNQTFTIEIRDAGGSTLFASGTIHPQQNGWGRYSLKYYETTTLAQRQLILKSASANSGSHPLYTDGWIVGPSSEELTYFDGDMQDSSFDSDPYAYAWTGGAHSSPSIASDHIHSHGKIVSFFDLGFLTMAVVGLGMFDPEVDITTLTDGEEILKGTFIPGKDFSIVGRLYAQDYSLLARKRQDLIDLLNILNSDSGLIQLAYQAVDKKGVPYGKRLWMQCAFLGGLSGNFNNLYSDTLELRFRLLNSRLYEEFGDVEELDYSGLGAATTYVYSRDPNTGEWEDYLVGSNATTGGQINCAIVMDDGTIVVGGSFTAIGGVSARRIAKWDPQTLAWSEFGGGFNSTVFGLALGRGDYAGNLIVVGAFTSNGAASATWRRIVRWDGIQFIEILNGLDNTVLDVDVAPNGWIYVVGTFLATGVGAVMRTFAGYDASPGGDDVWHNFVTSIAGTNTWTVKVSKDNTKVYIGGDFTAINGDTDLRCVAQWNTGPGGTGDYSAMETGLSAQVIDLEFGPDNHLYAAGYFSQDGAFTRLVRRFAKWNGVTWEEVGRGEIDTPMHFLAWDKRGNAYLSGEQIDPFGTETVLFQWNGSNWIPLDFTAENASFAATGRLFVSNDGRFFVTLPAGVGSIAFAGHTSLTYEGTADAKVKFSITGSGTLHRISNWTTNKHIYFESLVLLDDETLILDLTGSAPKAWTQYRPDILDSILIGSSDLDGFRLVPGVNHITVFIGGTTSANTEALISWNDHHWSIDAAIEA